MRVSRLATSIISAAFVLAVLVPTTPATADTTPACIPADRCCKVCDAGQACGNTCISTKKTCHKGRGCACNASEVCSASL